MLSNTQTNIQADRHTQMYTKTVMYEDTRDVYSSSDYNEKNNV